MTEIKIPFNKPFLTGKEPLYIIQAVYSGTIAGNGPFTKRCHTFFKQRFGFENVLLTASCTDALEMCALLAQIKPGDEVILPSYTFVSTANAFALRGAKLIFADSEALTPNIDPNGVKELIGPRTRMIVTMHYAGIACDLDKILALTKEHSLIMIEDAAHAIDSKYKGKLLGTFGALSTFSFHETKNVIAGEGGLLVVNEQSFWRRAEVIWEKGTDRAAFFRGEVDKYSWVDLGSSFLPSDIIAAFLFAQLENLENIQDRRKALWQRYHALLKPLQDLGCLSLPHVPDYATVNGHLYYALCENVIVRDALLKHLKMRGILAVFHYRTLHDSPYFADKHDGRPLPNASRFADCLLRFPLFYELTDEQQDTVIREVFNFFRS